MKKSGVRGPSMQKRTLQTRPSSFDLKPAITKLEQSQGGASSFELTMKGKRPAFVSEKKGKQSKVKPKLTQDESANKKGKPQYDKAATKKFDDMLDGDMQELPPMPKTMVKIFLSSTFSDMRAERNLLARRVYPVLSEFCTDHSLDFQVVDMRWGVTEDSQNDHSVEKLCLLEVNNCQKASLGPNFVVLSGDRYGFRPIPTEVSQEEFETLHSQADKLGLQDTALLDDWYKLDTNALPNMYLLQPIRSKFTFFADFSPGCDEPRKRDTAEWWKTFEKLQKVLRACADAAFKEKKLTEEQKHQYFCSVTECEIQEGIVKAQDVSSHALVYKRELLLLYKEAFGEENASRYVDVVQTPEGPKRDEVVDALKETLIKETIPKALGKKLIKHYKATWKPGGMDPDTHQDHRDYLEKFCDDFVADCQHQITQAVEQKRSLIMLSNYYSDYEDTIHHLRFCQSKIESFCGQEKVIDKAKAYILDDSNRNPLIIHGASGAGKTSITAMIMKLIPSWLKGAPHLKMIRFLGTSPQSNNINDVLFSIVAQLSDAFDQIMSPVSYKTMKNLVEFMPRFLRQMANMSKEPIIILLDSVDQLDPTNAAYAMEWLPVLLPANVKWILSTITEHQDILTNLKKRLPSEKCYVEVPILPEATGKLIVETYLKNNSRTITESQMKLLLMVFKQSPSPLFLKLLIDEARKWKSYTHMNEIRLASTVKEAISTLFETLESKFGHLLISHALGYITLGITGLTEFEIEDVLSCDDAVLNEVYKYHDPPIPGIVRIPPVLWARIRYDIREYLVERLSYGRTTLFWYHRQFIETARERYTSHGKDVELHRNLTEIYLQDSGVQRTITLKNRKNLTIKDADRQVRPLPFSTQNRRKLVCLPYHAMKAQTILGKDMVKEKVFCNLKFLTMKIAAFSISSVVSILKAFLEEQADSEISALLEFLMSSKNDLSNPTRLAVSLLANINPAEGQANLRELQEQARTLLLQQNKPLLIPTFPCLAPRKNLPSAPNTAIQGLAEILAATNEVLLLKNKTTEDGSEEARSEHAIFDAAGQDLQQIYLPKEMKSVCPECCMVDKDAVYFATKTSIVKHSYRTDTTSTVKLSELVPKLEPKDLVQKVSLNPNTSSAILVFKGSVALVDLAQMKCKVKYVTGKKLTQFDTAEFLPCDEDIKVVAVGGVNNSSNGDEPQGPQNQKFVCIFSGDKESPDAFLPIDSEFSTETMTLVGGNNKKAVFASKAENSDQGSTTTLQIFELSPLSQAKPLEVPGTVKMLSGDVDSPRVVALTINGVFYFIDSSESKIVSQTELNQTISTFSMLWEDQVSLLCSVSGSVTLYDHKQDKTLGAFTASSGKPKAVRMCEQEFVYLDTKCELKTWSAQGLITEAKTKDEKKAAESSAEEQMLDQVSVTCIGAATKEHHIYTCSREGYFKIWDSDTLKLLRQFNIGISVNQMKSFSTPFAAFLDTTLGEMMIIDCTTGENTISKSDLPSNVVAMTMDHSGTVLYVVSSPKKNHLQIDQFKAHQKVKTIALQKALPYTSVDLVLSSSERFLVMKTGVSDEEYDAIQALTKKSGSFLPQQHHWKFTAVDLSQGNGALVPCLRRLSKIPTLGTAVAPYIGNTVMMCCRRWVGLWDIPTGNFDQKPCKGADKHHGMFYRPSWVGADCRGTSYALALAPNSKFIVVGSEDGYSFVYDAETGLPRGKDKPTTKHNSEVHEVAISRDSQWVVSTCQGGVIKLWDSNTGQEQFSFRVDSKVQRMMFTPNDKLVFYTGTHTTRVLIFSIHTKNGAEEGEKAQVTMKGKRILP